MCNQHTDWYVDPVDPDSQSFGWQLVCSCNHAAAVSVAQAGKHVTQQYYCVHTILAACRQASDEFID